MPTSTPPALPAELIQQVIQSLVEPVNFLQYGHEKDVLQALLQLCLVNRFIYGISVFRLYSSIELADGRMLEDLIRTLKSSPGMRSHTHSLFLNNFFIRFSLIPEVGELLDLVSPYLRRLALCAPGSLFKHSNHLRPALGRLNHLEDFVRVGYPCGELGDIWSDWKALHRVLLVGIQVNKSFIGSIRYLPNLTHLWLIDASWGEGVDEYGLILEMLQAGSGLQQVVLVCGSSEELRQLLRFVRNLPEESLKSYFREGLDVQYLGLQATVGTLRAKVADGSFWEANIQNIIDTM